MSALREAIALIIAQNRYRDADGVADLVLVVVHEHADIEAARESVDMPAVVLLLWRIMELMGVGVADFPERDSTGFAMMIRDAIVNQELFAAALTPGDTHG